MKNAFLSIALLFLAIAASSAEGERAALQQQIAKLQAQLAPLEQMRKERDAAFENISVANPADLVAINTKYKAAQAQYAPIELQLSDLQATLRLLDNSPNPNLGTQNPRQNPVPHPGSDDPDKLLGSDDPGTPNPPPRRNPAPPPASDDLDIDLDLDRGSGHSPSSHGPSGHTTSTGHSGGSGGHSAPEHSSTGHSEPGHSSSGHSSSGGRDHQSGGHSSGQGHTGSTKHNAGSSGHSGAEPTQHPSNPDHP